VAPDINRALVRLGIARVRFLESRETISVDVILAHVNSSMEIAIAHEFIAFDDSGKFAEIKGVIASELVTELYSNMWGALRADFTY